MNLLKIISTALTFFILLGASLLTLIFGAALIILQNDKTTGAFLLILGILFSFITFEMFQIEKIEKEAIEK